MERGSTVYTGKAPHKQNVWVDLAPILHGGPTGVSINGHQGGVSKLALDEIRKSVWCPFTEGPTCKICAVSTQAFGL